MNETEGRKKRLKDALVNQERVKILFSYPGTQRATVKRGIVLKVYPDSFDFKEDRDGHATYSYNFITAIFGEAAEK